MKKKNNMIMMMTKTTMTVVMAYIHLQRERKWYILNGGSDRISVFSKSGRSKAINQDFMLAWEVCSSINRSFVNTELSKTKF